MTDFSCFFQVLMILKCKLAINSLWQCSQDDIPGDVGVILFDQTNLAMT